MSPRVRLALVVLSLSGAGLALVAALASRAEEEPVRGREFQGAVRPPGVRPVDFALRDQDGRRATLAEYRGRVVVLTFLYTTCRDTCPIQAQQVRGALDDLGHDVPTLAVSVDPAGDTPARARAFLLRQRLTGRMRFLLGPRSRLAPVWRGYGVRPQGEGFDHSAHVVLVDRAGRQRVGFPVDQLTPERLAHDIALLEAERPRA